MNVTKRKRVLSMLLTFLMVLTLLPAIAPVEVHAADFDNCSDCGELRVIWCEGCWKCSDCVLDSGVACPECDYCVECALDKTGGMCNDCFKCGDCTDICETCGAICVDHASGWCFDCYRCHECIMGGFDPCPDCGRCAWCSASAGGFCFDCGRCADDADICGVCESYCTDCKLYCPDCEKCEECLDGEEFCYACGYCMDCTGGYICEGCGDVCTECFYEWCEGCGLCGDCVELCTDCGDYCDECVAVCLDCGACEECTDLCPDCGEVCGGCANVCADCGLCDGCTTICQLCGSCCGDCYGMCENCDTCGECAFSCDECGARCQECAVLCTDCYKCEDCVDLCPDCGEICSECADVCLDCGLCGSCTDLCVDCGEVCGECADFCENCELCENCTDLCSDCGDYCPECTDVCPDCGTCEYCADVCDRCGFCGDCVTLCEGCGDVCKDCMLDDGQGFCPTCNLCESCANICIGCYEVCNNCEDICEDCYQCEDCCVCEGGPVITCPECGSTDGVRCSKNKDYCSECAALCPDCGTCEYCADVCDWCGLCGDCVTLCEDCGDVCKDCILDDGQGWCLTCNLCEGCAIICAGCGEGCNNCETVCEGCWESCSGCADLCDRCDSCGDCVTLCEGCGDVCKDCMLDEDQGWCLTCNLCEGCANICTDCMLVCNNCAAICAECYQCEDCCECLEIHTHSFGTAWVNNGTSHWHECSCGEKSGTAAHTPGDWIVDTAATETVDGSRHKECTVCAYVTATDAIPATGVGHTHSFGTVWLNDGTNHWHECSCGEKNATAAHTAGAWIVDLAATETVAGSRHKECTVCGEVLETEAIPATGVGHIHTISGWIVDVPATATTPGSRHKECTVCGETLETGTIPATGTDPGSSPGGSGGSSTPAKTDTEKAVDIIEKAEPGDTVKIDLGDKTEVTKEILGAIAGKDITVEITVGDVVWIIDGMDVPLAGFTGFDLGVSMGTSTIPVDIINAITGEKTTVQLTLKHDGPFGFPLVLQAPLGGENAGLYANLYFYNKSTGEMEFRTVSIIGEDGKAKLVFSRASEYAIVIDTKAHDRSHPFIDVTESDWFYSDVEYVYDAGLMTGTAEALFSPYTETSRAMIVTILYRLEGEPTVSGNSGFADVPTGSWYTNAVVWAQANGIVGGYSAEKFGPNDPITREQMAVILANYAKYKGYDVSASADLSKFSDAGSVSSWAVEAINWANSEGLINGKGGGILDPKGKATRAEVAAILTRFCENIVK